MNHKVVTHASTRISMSLGEAAPWMYLVSNSRHTYIGFGYSAHKDVYMCKEVEMHTHTYAQR